MKQPLIGRLNEQKILRDIYNDRSGHFLAITGRRRVGKTYLIKAFFREKISFDFSGTLNASMTDQLSNFDYALRQQFRNYKGTTDLSSWMNAFRKLASLLASNKGRQKQIVFIDELPWLDTHKSNFIAALDWFWNNWAVNRNVALIVCGSATSWMMNKIINNKGGLHNRLTKRIHLMPFTLSEAEQFLKQRRIVLSRYQLTQIYMALGGIPHYLKEINRGESAMRAIERICFKKNGLLVNEFDNLYKALFVNHKNYVKIVLALSAKNKGLSRGEILSKTKLRDGGTFTSMLDELEWCNFIQSQPSFNKRKKDCIYRLTDEFSLFYIRFMYGKKKVNWMQLSAGSVWKTWSGYAFESLCIKHEHALKRALGISGVYTQSYSFSARSTKSSGGTQIDLLIDRNDSAINLCEVKFHNKEFMVTKKFAAEMRNRRDIFEQQSRTRKSVFITLITSYGIISNAYSSELVDASLDMNALFAE